MDRLLRLGGGMPGLNQGPPPSDAPVVDTAEQVPVKIPLYFYLFRHLIFVFVLTGVHIVFSSLENA